MLDFYIMQLKVLEMSSYVACWSSAGEIKDIMLNAFYFVQIVFSTRIITLQFIL
jgi:hypothetical protein